MKDLALMAARQILAKEAAGAEIEMAKVVWAHRALRYYGVVE